MKSQSRTIALYLFAVSAGWLGLVAIVWLVTGTTVPTVNVRWKDGVTADERLRTEQQLSLVLHEPGGRGTNNYFVMDPTEQTLGRIVQHPLIEDTAFINRGTFELENPPTVRMWFGDRFSTRWLLGSLYLSLFGCLTSGVVLAPRE